MLEGTWDVGDIWGIVNIGDIRCPCANKYSTRLALSAWLRLGLALRLRFMSLGVQETKLTNFNSGFLFQKFLVSFIETITIGL